MLKRVVTLFQIWLCLDRAAFIDNMVISLWGTRRKKPTRRVRLTKSYSTLSQRAIYVRSQHFRSSSTAHNVGEFRYGLFLRSRLPRVPPYQLRLQSGRLPITYREVKASIDAFMAPGWTASISIVEFTRDISGVDFDSMLRDVFGTAHTLTTVVDSNAGQSWRKTLYLGNRRSAFQLKIYQKRPEFVRVEFVLRRPFLRTHGFSTLRSIRKLNRFDFTPWTHFLSLDRGAVMRQLGPLPWQHEGLVRMCLRNQEVVRALRKLGHDVRPLLVNSPLNVQLGAMQRNFVW